MASTLYDFYGGNLPSIAERSGTYKGYGFTDAYQGSASQNINLLAKLKGGKAPVGTVIAPKSPQDAYGTALQNYQNYFSQAEKPSAMLARLQSEQGLSGVQGNIRRISEQLGGQYDLLGNLDEDIADRTKGFDVRESQRRQLLAKETEPLTENIDRLSRAKGIETEDYNTRVGLVNALLEASGMDFDRGLKPLEIGLEESRSERDYQRDLAKESRTAGRASAKAKTASRTDISSAIRTLQETRSENPSERERVAAGGQADEFLSKNEALDALNRLIAIYDDEDLAYDVFKRAFQAGGFKKYGEYDL